MDLTPEAIRASLNAILDPELGVGIVAMGYLHSVESDRGIVQVRLTLCSPQCPRLDWFVQQVRNAVLRSWPDVRQVQVEFVWDPPWTPERVSEPARRALGWRT